VSVKCGHFKEQRAWLDALMMDMDI